MSLEHIVMGLVQTLLVVVAVVVAATWCGIACHSSRALFDIFL